MHVNIILVAWGDVAHNFKKKKNQRTATGHCDNTRIFPFLQREELPCRNRRCPPVQIETNLIEYANTLSALNFMSHYKLRENGQLINLRQSDAIKFKIKQEPSLHYIAFQLTSGCLVNVTQLHRE